MSSLAGGRKAHGLVNNWMIAERTLFATKKAVCQHVMMYTGRLERRTGLARENSRDGETNGSTEVRQTMNSTLMHPGP